MPLIKVEHIWKIYKLGDIDLEVLKDVSLEIERGEFCTVKLELSSGTLQCVDLGEMEQKPSRSWAEALTIKEEKPEDVLSWVQLTRVFP